MKKILSFILSLILIITICAGMDYSALASDAYANNDYARTGCHDPSIVKGDNGRYYTFGSHMAYSYSDDLVNWYSGTSTMDGDGTQSLLSYDGKSWKETCAKAFDWTTRCQKAWGRTDDQIEYGCWAPSVVYNATMKKWCMYTCASTWGSVASVIFLATSDNIEGPYTFVDTMIYSGFTSYNKLLGKSSKKDYNYTYTNVLEALGSDYESEIRNSTTGWFTDNNGYNCGYGMYPNCIDPTGFTDKNGDMWMVYGSFSGGTFVVPLVEETGLVDYAYMNAHKSNGYDPYFGMRVSSTHPDDECSGEGPFIVYDEQSDYYYFYLTYEGLGGTDGYNIREYRSKNPDGPYVDKAGNKATESKFTGAKLMGNYQFSCQPTGYLSGGHSSSFIDDDGKMYQAYHTRFTCDGGWGHQLRVHQMLRTKDGWAVMLPYEYQGETVSNTGYSVDEIVGTYEFVNHTSIGQHLDHDNPDAQLSSIMLPTQTIELAPDGTIYNLKEYGFSIISANTSSKIVSGTWSKTNGTYYATFKINGVTYNGVFCKQKDESANGNEVMTFAALGTNNAEIWGVQTNNHTPKITSTVTPATAKANGKVVKKCSVCGMTASYPVSKIAIVSLSATSYIYNGKAKKPTITVKDSNGKKISSSNYTVTYSNNTKIGTANVKVTFKGNYTGTISKTFTINPKISLSATSYTYNGKSKKPTVTVKDGNGKKINTKYYTISYSFGRKNVGKYTVTIKFKNGHKGTYKKTFTIKPKSTSISTITAKSKGFTVKWKKRSTQTTGYQIQYSTNSNFTDAKIVTVSKNSTTSKTISNLSARKSYHVRVRTYRTVSGTKYYSSWSNKKTVITKK